MLAVFLTVSKVSGIGEDSLFMGVLEVRNTYTQHYITQIRRGDTHPPCMQVIESASLQSHILCKCWHEVQPHHLVYSVAVACA